MQLLGSSAPNFNAQTTMGDINFHDYIDKSWGILFSHPSDFTPVCTTELSYMVKLVETEFKHRNVKVLALSCDSSVESHLKWIEDIEAYHKLSVVNSTGFKLNFPIIADEDRKIANLFHMIPLEGAQD